MRKLLLSTTIVAASAFAAVAQDQGELFRTEVDTMEVRASDFIGMRVYSSEAAVEADAFEGVQEGWEDIGEINDVILSRDGNVEAVLVDIGGFLGIGERQVAVDMDALRFVSDSATGDVDSDFFVVLTASRGMFEEAPEYGMTGQDDAMTDQAMTDPAVEGTEGAAGTDTAATDPTLDGTADPAADTAQVDPAMQDPAMQDGIAREGYLAAEPDYVTSENLTGATVYDANDERVGSISDLILTADGQIEHAVVDIGGFLGIGARPVAIQLDHLSILRAADGDDLRIYVSSTREQLEALPRFEG